MRAIRIHAAAAREAAELRHGMNESAPARARNSSRRSTGLSICWKKKWFRSCLWRALREREESSVSSSDASPIPSSCRSEDASYLL